jgi:hypothetical protein
VALGAVLIAKAAFPGQPWGLPLGKAEPLASAAPLRDYARQQRPNELIVVSPEDQFYSSTLLLPKVRYAFIDPAGVVVKYSPHYAYLGITLSSAQFLDLPELRSQYAPRLRSWGMDSEEPLATAIVLHSAAEIETVVRAKPRSDFMLPGEMAAMLPDEAISGRSIVRNPGGTFLLAGEPGDDVAPAQNRSRKLPSW